MSDKIAKGRFIVVEWKSSDKPKTEDKLKNFLKARTPGEDPKIKLGSRKTIAVIEFKTEKDPGYLKQAWIREDFWEITDIYAVPETHLLKVENIPTNAETRQIYRYFTNETNVKIRLTEVKVEEKYFRPQGGVCVVALKSAEDVQKVCAKSDQFQKFRENKLKVSPYYEAADPLSDDNFLFVEPITLNDIDATKIIFLKDQYFIEDKFKEKCGRIIWCSSCTQRVILEFDCPHDSSKRQHSETWKQSAEKMFSDILDSVSIVRKPLSAEVWSAASDIVRKVSGNILVEEDEKKKVIVLAGFKDDKTLIDIERKIDQIAKSKPFMKREIKIPDKNKLIVFQDLSLNDCISGVDFDFKTSSNIIILCGDEQLVKDAETSVLEMLNQITFRESSLQSSDVAVILASQQIKDKIKKEKDQKGWRCGYNIIDNKLRVFGISTRHLELFEEMIKSYVVVQNITYTGKVANVRVLEQNLKKVEHEYSPYAKLSIKFQKNEVLVQKTCLASYKEPLDEELERNIVVHLIKDEILQIDPNTIKYITKNALGSIKKEIALMKLKEDVLEINETKGTIRVTGNARVRQQIVGVVQDLADKVHSHWIPIEIEGIHDYIMGGNGYNIVKDINDKKQCSIRMATLYEMNDHNIYCIVPLETGQALFVGHGSLTNPNYPVDAIVNAANKELNHKGGLAKEIVDKGGKSIQEDCTIYIKNRGRDLNVGDVYVGHPGKLPCQRVIHAVGPEWKGGNNNEINDLEKVMENIIRAINSDEKFLRTIAMPLISSGVFGVPKIRAAKILMLTIKRKLKDFPKVREIYFYDRNQEVVRTIQKQMQAVFGSKCFHMPSTNIGIGQGTMTKIGVSQLFKLRRTGSRTLPLPRNRTLVVQWGDIAKTNAEVVVCPTTQAPKPSGTIIKVLTSMAGVQFDLMSECVTSFKTAYNDGNVPDGGLTETLAGRLPCTKIYHVKIAATWNKNKKQAKECVASYIKKCLERAVRQKVSEIAFPTIGTVDCGYPADEVARIFFKSITNFVKLHPTCTLEKISIIIYNTDILVTTAFEGVMEEIYNCRPHRLKADIEEHSTEKTNEKPSQTTTESTIVKNNEKQSGRSQSNTSFNVGSSSKCMVKLEESTIELSKTDVIVCTTSSFPTLNGAIASAIIKNGGQEIQDECKKQYQKYPDSGMAMTSAGKLKCKKVFFVVLQNYKPNKNEKSIYGATLKCLEEAENQKYSSVAMPTFGTGGFKYPGRISATETFSAIKDFFKTPKKHLKDIIIVLFGPDHDACKAFRTEADANSNLTSMAVQKVPGSYGQQDTNTSTQTDNSGSLSWNVPNASISLEITYGNLASAKADVILNTTTSYPELTGAIPEDLCRIAGPQLKQACANYKGVKTEGIVDETSGFNLNCKKVYHLLMPKWRQATGEKMIEDFIMDSLNKMKQSNMRTIAIPSLGTGGAHYNPNKVARGIYRAIQTFGQQNQGMKCGVILVLFPASVDINKTFVEELKSFKGSTGATPKSNKKGVQFKTDDVTFECDDDDIVIPRKRRNFVLFQITSDDPKHVKEVISEIQNRIDKEIKTFKMTLSTENNISDVDLMKGENWKKVLEFGEGYKVKITMDEKAKVINVHGFGDSVMECYQQILTFIGDIRLAERNKRIGKIVSQHIEWYYTEDNGNIWVPYPKNIGYVLEGAFSTQAKQKEFRDTDDKMYVADFNAMVEYSKDDEKLKTSKVSMIRKDFTEGLMKRLPEDWAPMEEGLMLKEVKLQSTDPEYKQVVTELMKTASGSPTIVEIRRIQNQFLYQQYEMMKEQLQTTHKNTVSVIERFLWHGTTGGTENSITLNGFNRSYSGKTHNDVWYGHGVYFAVDSKYSLMNHYSPPDGTGLRRMYQVKVLTGKTTSVQRGYSDRYAPLLPGSSTERFDSTCDDVNNPTEFVIFRDTQSYPNYIIYFKL